MSIEYLTLITTYLLIILAELGDKTQLAVLLITSNNPRKKWFVFLASAIALSLCVLVEVTVGAALARHIAPHIINKIAGAVFLIIGLVGLIKYFASLRPHTESESLNSDGKGEQVVFQTRG